MGSLGRSDYTCIGDPVNLASRAEGLCKVYGAKIILTQFTKELLTKEHYLLRELDFVKVKGKNEPVKIYECMGTKDNFWVKTDDRQMQLYNEALFFYRNSDFKQALLLFEALNREDSQKLYELYLQRCNYFIKNPPENFNGIFTLSTK